MSINLSFRNNHGQFVRHSLVINSVLVKIGGALALLAIERAAGLVVDATTAYWAERKLRKNSEFTQNKVDIYKLAGGVIN